MRPHSIFCLMERVFSAPASWPCVAVPLFLFANAAQACDCGQPTADQSRWNMLKAYIIVHGTLREVVPITQRHGVVNRSGPGRALIDVAYAYDQPFSGSLYVDFSRSNSDCGIGPLEVGEERDVIVFKDENDALYLPSRCVGLTEEHWAELHEKAAAERARAEERK